MKCSTYVTVGPAQTGPILFLTRPGTALYIKILGNQSLNLGYTLMSNPHEPLTAPSPPPSQQNQRRTGTSEPE